MNFTLSEDQQAILKVARQLFEHRATKEHLEELEKQDVRFDPDLWDEMASSDLLGLAVPEEHGGSGYSFLELCMLLTEVGWAVAPVPAYETLVLGAETIRRYGAPEIQQRYLPGVADGSRRLTAALEEPGRSDPTTPVTTATRDGSRWRIDGAKELVPAAQISDQVLVPATSESGAVVAILDADAAGVDITSVTTTSGQPYSDVTFDGALAADVIEDDVAVAGLHTLALIGLAATQVGVSDRALQIAARYTSEREQFGRPIGTFQAVQQRLADGFIDLQAMKWTMYYAAWLVAEERPATREAAIAKFWAGEGGARIAASTQQVHGGIGIDITYPLFRYTLWAKQIELSLGAPSHHIARLGATYAEGAR